MNDPDEHGELLLDLNDAIKETGRIVREVGIGERGQISFTRMVIGNLDPVF